MGCFIIRLVVCLVLVFACNCFFTPHCYAELTGSVQYNPYQYSKKDIPNLLQKAGDNLKMFEITEDKSQKEKYLKEALRYYYICSKTDFTNIEAHIGLGKVYDEMGVDRYAKMEFNSAYNINNKNPKLNYRYGDFYYKRRQLNMAQNYFERAYNFGYSKNYDLNNKMAKMYIKLAEPQKAAVHSKIVEQLEKEKQQQKARAAMSNTIKQAAGLNVSPVESKPVSQVQKPQKVSDISQNINKPQVNKQANSKINQNNKEYEQAVLNANKIKMIDDADKLRPMYYLFIK